MDRAATTVLLRQARDGSSEALNGLFERHAGRLLALIRLRMGRGLRRRVESRDVLNSVLLKALQGLDDFAGADSSSLMAWLARIAENEIRDQADFHGRQRRDAGREVALDDEAGRLAAEVRSLSSRIVLQEDVERLHRALLALDETQREVIILRRYEELSFKEIGERLERSPDACRMLLARALTALTLKLRGSV